MSSSSSRTPGLTPLPTPELRAGVWTRFGATTVLGDEVTEQTLHALAESTRTAARSQGYAVGWAEGQRAAREAADQDARAHAETSRLAEEERVGEHRAAVRALELAAARLHETVAEVCGRLESRVSALAGDLTETILGELRHDVDAVRRALALAPEGEPVAIRVHPSAVAEAAGVRVIADPSLLPGDALVEYDDHVLDLRITTALERVREVLQ
jgi:flagellar assembly protein FliH